MISPIAAYLLQSDFDRGSQSSSPVGIFIFVIAIIGVVVLIVVNAIRSKGDSSHKGYDPARAAEAASKAPSFQASGFRRASQAIGLSGEQISFLESYGRKLKLSNPDHVLRNPEALEAFLRSVFQDIETHSESQAVADQKAATLFQIRERIELSRSGTARIESTHGLRSGTVVTCITADGDNYTSRIEAMSADGMACAIPLDGLGQELRFRRGSRLTVFFYTGNQNGFSFETKVSGYTRLREGNAMVLRHSERVKPLPVREHKRKSMNQPCDFTPVTIVMVKQGSKTTKKAVTGNRSIPGQITDISAGGLSLRSANPLESGEYLKIDFSGRSAKLSAIGRVVSLSRVKGSGGTMHVQYAKISRQDLNKVLSMVYGYGE
jgi:hypothetical protein